jgi:hypothetical protein
LHGAGALLLGFQFGKSCLEFIVSRFSHAATSTLLFLDIQIVAATSKSHQQDRARLPQRPNR